MKKLMLSLALLVSAGIAVAQVGQQPHGPQFVDMPEQSPGAGMTVAEWVLLQQSQGQTPHGQQP